MPSKHREHWITSCPVVTCAVVTFPSRCKNFLQSKQAAANQMRSEGYSPAAQPTPLLKTPLLHSQCECSRLQQIQQNSILSTPGNYNVQRNFLISSTSGYRYRLQISAEPHLDTLAAPLQSINLARAGIRVVVVFAEAGLDLASFLLAGVLWAA